VSKKLTGSQLSLPCAYMHLFNNVVLAMTAIILPPTKEEVNVFARVCLSACLCLSVSKITQKRVHGFR